MGGEQQPMCFQVGWRRHAHGGQDGGQRPGRERGQQAAGDESPEASLQVEGIHAQGQPTEPCRDPRGCRGGSAASHLAEPVPVHPALPGDAHRWLGQKGNDLTRLLSANSRSIYRYRAVNSISALLWRPFSGFPYGSWPHRVPPEPLALVLRFLPQRRMSQRAGRRCSHWRAGPRRQLHRFGWLWPPSHGDFAQLLLLEVCQHQSIARRASNCPPPRPGRFRAGSPGWTFAWSGCCALCAGGYPIPPPRPGRGNRPRSSSASCRVEQPLRWSLTRPRDCISE